MDKAARMLVETAEKSYMIAKECGIFRSKLLQLCV